MVKSMVGLGCGGVVFGREFEERVGSVIFLVAEYRVLEGFPTGSFFREERLVLGWFG